VTCQRFLAQRLGAAQFGKGRFSQLRQRLLLMAKFIYDVRDLQDG
jgi:hypothetical protein